ncbi:MAG TPA: TraC family protein [Candidatus Saccharimonadales bacterium]|nr:TraC family protein [Candidatus Saccharimonadales bacterium]
MSILQKSSKKASARQQINIKGVRGNMLLLPHDQYRLVIEVSPVNFELKSEEEQDALIDTYESFLDSLPCPLEIVVRIRELDMDKYLADTQELLHDEKEEVYRDQIKNYAKFVQGLVADNKILSRHFYVVLPYTTSDFETAKEQLSLNADMVSKGLSRLGMRTRQLTNIELLDLFHTFYNPGQAKRQPISDQVAELLNNSYIRKEQA